MTGQERESRPDQAQARGSSTGPSGRPFSPPDFNRAPFLVLWELTRSCQLACKHCRAEAICQRNPDELTLAECGKVLDELERFGRPLIVLTGGDPAQRPDLFEIIEECRRRGFTVAMTPSGTPSVSLEMVRRLKEAGLERIAISLDSPQKQQHDDFRGVVGSFDWSMNILRWARDCDLPIQINTTVCRNNYDLFDDMAKTVEQLKAVLWSVFFLVPVGRADQKMQISAIEAELVMNKMARLARTSPFDVKSTAAPQFRRVLLKGQREETSSSGQSSGDNRDRMELGKLDHSLKLGRLRSYGAVNDAMGLVFISHTGDILPSGFLPLVAGNVRTESLVDVYRDSELFTQLRDRSLLKGKCGACEFKQVCGGSRARAFGSYGDFQAEDPLCIYRSSN